MCSLLLSTRLQLFSFSCRTTVCLCYTHGRNAWKSGTFHWQSMNMLRDQGEVSWFAGLGHGCHKRPSFTPQSVFVLFIHLLLLFCISVGFAKNRSISQSKGIFLCFLDAVRMKLGFFVSGFEHERHMTRKWLPLTGWRNGSRQSAIAVRGSKGTSRFGESSVFTFGLRPQTKKKKKKITVFLQRWLRFSAFALQIVGCKFTRDPEGSTERYTKWANSLSQEQLATQVRAFLHLMWFWNFWSRFYRRPQHVSPSTGIHLSRTNSDYAHMVLQSVGGRKCRRIRRKRQGEQTRSSASFVSRSLPTAFMSCEKSESRTLPSSV